jgi:hypothetical protein
VGVLGGLGFLISGTILLTTDYFSLGLFITRRNPFYASNVFLILTLPISMISLFDLIYSAAPAKDDKV